MTSSAVSGKTLVLTLEGDAMAETRNFTITMNQALIDVTSRDSSFWHENIVATRDWEVAFEGLYIYNDVAKKVLQNHFASQTPTAITALLTFPNAETLTGECRMVSMVYTGPYNEALTISGSLKGTGVLTQSAS